MIKSETVKHHTFVFSETFFGETHRLTYKKSNFFVYAFVINGSFFEMIVQGTPYKAQNWHALSHQYTF